MNKKKIAVMGMLLVVLVGAFAGIAVTITKTTPAASSAEGGSDNDQKVSGEADDSMKAAAETLIDQTVSRDKVKEEVGEWKDFEMDGNGCERGVYAGRFYYDGFIIYSRTYDKGETFHIMSINE